ncbi:DUF1329 domain-containing protein [Ramlibacter sp. WS9]|uniref:DUF1329 domain-containing protein n=1 Tax=Ramlibacter sp. WS9 TaxID=1882741 RepID=UPI0011439408|nr:DUF1329 domain-containing protein [Ramlibacter sp. WS9]ROZ68746.1 DUF1329 domain-containing protein [Ramlibacter sp. WS9]
MNCIRQQSRSIGLAVLLVLAMAGAQAKAPADQIDRLGKDLTPMGAERAANKDGTIPAWTGGIVKPPAGFDIQKGYADPFAADKPLYTITGANAEQYKDKLAPGQLALLKRYSSYKLVVYPTRRSAGYSDAVYAGIKREAAKIDTTNEGNSVVNRVESAVPFPIPGNGVEAIWNHIFRYRGESFARDMTEFPVLPDGTFTPVKRQEEVVFGHALKDPELLFAFSTVFKSPSSISGEALIVKDFTDQMKQSRAAWIYNPGTRRVLRAPEISYDTPRNGVDGLSTVDDYDGYNGAPDRFTWKLIGKREMIVSYNNYRLTDRSLKYKDIIKPGTMNQELVRYELHRVWAIEATLRADKSHVYHKRMYYLDEDSWQVVHGDLYDGRGELWRVLEVMGTQFYTAPAFYIAGMAQYDLQARRYVSSNLSNEDKPVVFNVPLKASQFTPDALRRMGN